MSNNLLDLISKIFKNLFLILILSLIGGVFGGILTYLKYANYGDALNNSGLGGLVTVSLGIIIGFISTFLLTSIFLFIRKLFKHIKN